MQIKRTLMLRYEPRVVGSVRISAVITSVFALPLTNILSAKD